MAVSIPEKSGSFRQLLRPRNVTEFSYRHDGSDKANVFMSVQSIQGMQIDEDKPA